MVCIVFMLVIAKRGCYLNSAMMPCERCSPSYTSPFSHSYLSIAGEPNQIIQVQMYTMPYLPLPCFSSSLKAPVIVTRGNTTDKLLTAVVVAVRPPVILACGKLLCNQCNTATNPKAVNLIIDPVTRELYVNDVDDVALINSQLTLFVFPNNGSLQTRASGREFARIDYTDTALTLPCAFPAIASPS